MYRGEFHSSALDKLRRIARRRRGAALALGGVAAALAAASPAEARDFNCFEWVASAAHHVIHPRPHHTARAIRVKAVTRPRPHRIRPLATHYVRRPIACAVQEAALASPVPGAPASAIVPETPQEILGALAGPPVIVTPPVELTPAPVVVFPPILPPETPPLILTPPGVPQFPPTLGPPGLPPGGPGLGPVGGVPEPATWALMLAGFGAIGVALRRRTHALRA